MTLTSYRPIAIALCAILAGLVLWFWLKPELAPVGEHVPAKVAPQVKVVPKLDLKIQKVKVYASVAKAKLKLPAAYLDNPDVHVLESSRVEPDLHPQTVTTIIDAGTGETRTLIRREPDPWLAVRNSGEIRIDYGYKSHAMAGGGFDKIARLTFREELLQVKAFYVGMNASLDSDGQHFVGVGVAWKW